MSLLDKAKASPFNKNTRTNISDELLELSIEWARGNITNGQVATALNVKAPSSIYSVLAISLKKFIKDNNI